MPKLGISTSKLGIGTQVRNHRPKISGAASPRRPILGIGILEPNSFFFFKNTLFSWRSALRGYFFGKCFLLQLEKAAGQQKFSVPWLLCHA